MINAPLTDIATLQHLLHKAGTKPMHSLGQNFLISPEVVEATVLAAKQGPPHVTELGAGVGTLTQALVGAGFTVRAIERDQTLAQLLPKSLPASKRSDLQVIKNDLRHTDWTWTNEYQLIGNIPYNVSGLILRRLTQLTPPPQQAILLVQKEVGERLTAQPPKLSLIGLAVQLWGQAHLLLNVPRHNFWPAPQVDSQLIIMLPSPNPLPLEQREALLKTAKVFFQQRRKQIGGVLKNHWPQLAEQATPVFAKAGIDPTARPQELTITQWRELHDILK